MQRATARLVLMVLLLGVLVPAANAVALDPMHDQMHACCRRKPVQSTMAGMPHCHEMAGPAPDSNSPTDRSEPRLISSNSCASHECCRSLARSQWAQPAQFAAGRNLETLSFNTARRTPQARTITPGDIHSGRAPPIL